MTIFVFGIKEIGTFQFSGMKILSVFQLGELKGLCSLTFIMTTHRDKR